MAVQQIMTSIVSGGTGYGGWSTGDSKDLNINSKTVIYCKTEALKPQLQMERCCFWYEALTTALQMALSTMV